MPRGRYANVRSAIAAEVDARQFSGVPAYSFGASSAIFPTYSGVGDGLYDDILSFLNGKGCQPGQTIADRIAIFWPTGNPTTLDCYITSDDRFVIRCSEPFSIEGGYDNHLFGIDPNGQTATGPSAGLYFLYGDRDWIRGNIPHDTELKFTIPTHTFYVYTPRYQDLPTACVVTTQTDTLESLFVSEIHWGVDELGVCWWSTPGLDSDIVWDNDTLKRELGFTGDEPRVSASSTFGAWSFSDGLTRGIVIPWRPFVFNDPFVEQEGDAKRQRNGDWTGVDRGSFVLRRFAFWLDGPSEVCTAVGPSRRYDNSEHWLRYCLPRLITGRVVTLYQDWGDSRTAAYTTDGAEYSNTVTVEIEGYRGRLFGRVTNTAKARALTWPHRIKRRSPQEMTIQVEAI